jgi:hypothetical protein
MPVLLLTIITVILIRCVTWAEHVTRIRAIRNALRELVEVLEGRKPISSLTGLLKIIVGVLTACHTQYT